MAGLQHHLGGGGGGMALEGGAAARGIDPGIADPPKQQQRAAQPGEEGIEGFTAGDVKHGAEHPEGPRIPGGPQDGLHQLLIDVGAIDVDLVEGAAHCGRPPQVFKDEALHDRAAQHRAANGAGSDGPPAAGGILLLAEGAGGIEQHHPGGLIAQGGGGRQGGVAAEGVSHQHGRAADLFGHVGHQLVAPEGTAVGQPFRFGTAAETEQVNGMHFMPRRQGRDVVAPVVGGGAETMHQQNGGPLRPLGRRPQGMDGMAVVGPADRNSSGQGGRSSTGRRRSSGNGGTRLGYRHQDGRGDGGRC